MIWERLLILHRKAIKRFGGIYAVADSPTGRTYSWGMLSGSTDPWNHRTKTLPLPRASVLIIRFCRRVEIVLNLACFLIKINTAMPWILHELLRQVVSLVILSSKRAFSKMVLIQLLSFTQNCQFLLLFGMLTFSSSSIFLYIFFWLGLLPGKQVDLRSWTE